MLLPALNKARDKAKTIKCVNQQKQIGTAHQLYINDSDGFAATCIPPGGNPWAYVLAPYTTKNMVLWRCPDTPLGAEKMKSATTDKMSIAVSGTFKWYAGIGINSQTFSGRTPTNKLKGVRVNRSKKPSYVIYSADGRTGKEYQSLLSGDPNANQWLNLRYDMSLVPIENVSGQYSFNARHDGKINVSFLDGHVKTVGATEFLMWGDIDSYRRKHFEVF